MNFTAEQDAIIRHDRGHCRVSAVAGSGKTATLIERVSWLLDQGVSPGAILVVMFNTSAADQFNERLKKRLPDADALPEAMTFHSLGRRLCDLLSSMKYLPALRLCTKASVINRLAAQAMLKTTGEYPSATDLEDFIAFIDLVKADILSAEEKLSEAVQQYTAPLPVWFIDAFGHFEADRTRGGYRFFADLIADPARLFLFHPHIRDLLNLDFRHVIVDEYQDINDAQQALVQAMAGNTADVMVVGDEDQCIYDWRGARPEYLSEFFDYDYPDCTTYCLTQTFRFGHATSVMANGCLANNKTRLGKTCVSAVSTDNTVVQRMLDSDLDARMPLLIKEWATGGHSLSDVAILGRTYGAMVQCELMLLAHQIPFHIEGRASALDRDAIVILGGILLKAAGRLAPSYSYGRWLAAWGNLCCPLPREHVEALCETLASYPNKQSIGLSSFFAEYKVDPAKQQVIAAQLSLLTEAEGFAKESADVLLRQVESRFKMSTRIRRNSRLTDSVADQLAAVDLFKQLFTGMSVPEAAGLLTQMLDNQSTTNNSLARGTITLTTLHRSKGREWPWVILTGLQDSIFPGNNDRNTSKLEAERRLFYVGITRAKQLLTLVHPADTALDHAVDQRSGATPAGGRPAASRFLYEANLALAADVAGAVVNGSQSTISGVDLTVARCYLDALPNAPAVIFTGEAYKNQSNAPLCGPGMDCRVVAGSEVLHRRFGLGVVNAVRPRGQGFAINVTFKSGKSREIPSNLDVLYASE